MMMKNCELLGIIEMKSPNNLLLVKFVDVFREDPTSCPICFLWLLFFDLPTHETLKNMFECL